MATAPQQNWSYYDSRVQPVDADWLRSLSVEERFQLYNGLYSVLLQGRRTMPGDWDRLDQFQWAEKLKLRRRMVEAFSKLDDLRRERSAPNHAL